MIHEVADSNIINILNDENMIRQQLNNYCRSMDRCDKELGYSVFHPDGKVDYGDGMFKGDPKGLVDYSIDAHINHLDSHHHRIFNISIVVDGDEAGSETYVEAKFRGRDNGVLVERFTCGRYIDNWEKRDGRWAILRRRYIHEMDDVKPAIDQQFPRSGRRDRSDPSYEVLAT